MKSAFLIVAHGNFDMLKCLIKSLDYADNAMFIHIDKKCGDIDYTQFESIAKHSYVECLHDRVSVTWGGVSQIACTLKLLRCAVPHRYDYYHLISGVDYPLMSNEDLSLFLDSNKGCEFVGFVNERKNLKNKLGYYHFFIDSHNRLMKRAGGILIKIQKFMGIRQYKDIDYFAKGCNWN